MIHDLKRFNVQKLLVNGGSPDQWCRFLHDGDCIETLLACSGAVQTGACAVVVLLVRIPSSSVGVPTVSRVIAEQWMRGITTLIKIKLY